MARRQRSKRSLAFAAALALVSSVQVQAQWTNSIDPRARLGADAQVRAVVDAARLGHGDSAPGRVGSAADEPPLQILFPPNSLTTLSSSDSTAGAPAVPSINTTAEPPPGPPGQAVGNLAVTVNRADANNKTIYLSVPVTGNFLGLSLEFNTLDTLIGRTPDKLNAPFLSYLAAVSARARTAINVRLGGASQDTGLFNTTPSGFVSAASKSHASNADAPSTIIQRNNGSFTFDDMLFMSMKNLSSAVPVEYWYGLNFANKTLASTGPEIKSLQSIVGDAVKYLTIGDAVDRYEASGLRPAPYTTQEYSQEFGTFTNDQVLPNWSGPKKSLVAPDTYGTWSYTNFTGQGGFLQTYQDRIGVYGTMRYPQSGCNNEDYQAEGHGFYLYHPNTVSFASAQHLDRQAVVSSGLPVYLTQTGTASCDGVPDVSNTFTAALWGVDAALQLASYNYSGAFYHTKSSSGYDNLMSQVSVNTSGGEQKYFSTGPLMYSCLMVAEALAPATAPSSRVQDLDVPRADLAGYAIYENEDVARFALINMINDQSGANTWQAQIPVPTSQHNVTYKLLTAPSVQSNDNITWAGQSFGYWSVGQLQGSEDIKSATCNNGQCTIPVPAPGAALVFITNQAAAQAYVAESESAIIPTGGINITALKVSNGGRGNRLGSTSNGTSASILKQTSPNLAIGSAKLNKVLIGLTISLVPALLLL